MSIKADWKFTIICQDDLYPIALERYYKTLENREGYVYLAHVPETKYYKIGLSINPELRKFMHASLPFELSGLTAELIHEVDTNDMYMCEEYFHDIFGEKRIDRTEWFILDEQDVQYVKQWKQMHFSHGEL